MTVGKKVLFVCKFEGCENPPKLMKPSTAANQDFCSKSCASKSMWKTRITEARKEPKRRETCLVEECPKEPRGRNGFCRQHYTRWHRSGDPLVLKRKEGSCAPECTCNRHNAKNGYRVPSQPCRFCGEVKMVQPCYGPDGNQTRKFCNPDCWRSWQAEQAAQRRATGNTKAWDMSSEEFEERLAAQKNRCAICDKTILGRDIHRDHCHDTGDWRGLLCNGCNRGLGYFKDSPELLVAAAFYLVKSTDVIGFLTKGRPE